MYKMTITGNLTKDPETVVRGDKTVTNFTIAANNNRNRDKKIYVKCVAWNGAGKTIEQYAKRGSKMMVIGCPEIKQFTGADNKEHASLELTVEDFEFESSHAATAEYTPVARAEVVPATTVDPYNAVTGMDNFVEVEEDDGLPF